MIQKRQVWFRSLQGGIQFPRVFYVRNPLVWLAIHHRQRSKRKGQWALLDKLLGPWQNRRAYDGAAAALPALEARP